MKALLLLPFVLLAVSANPAMRDDPKKPPEPHKLIAPPPQPHNLIAPAPAKPEPKPLIAPAKPDAKKLISSKNPQLDCDYVAFTHRSLSHPDIVLNGSFPNPATCISYLVQNSATYVAVEYNSATSQCRAAKKLVYSDTTTNNDASIYVLKPNFSGDAASYQWFLVFYREYVSFFSHHGGWWEKIEHDVEHAGKWVIHEGKVISHEVISIAHKSGIAIDAAAKKFWEEAKSKGKQISTDFESWWSKTKIHIHESAADAGHVIDHTGKVVVHIGKEVIDFAHKSGLEIDAAAKKFWEDAKSKGKQISTDFESWWAEVKKHVHTFADHAGHVIDHAGKVVINETIHIGKKIVEEAKKTGITIETAAKKAFEEAKTVGKKITTDFSSWWTKVKTHVEDAAKTAGHTISQVVVKTGEKIVDVGHKIDTGSHSTADSKTGSVAPAEKLGSAPPSNQKLGALPPTQG